MLIVGGKKINSAAKVACVLKNYYDNTYAARAYSQWHVEQDSRLTASDLFVSCAISGRPNPFDDAYLELFVRGKAKRIEQALRRIPMGLSLADAPLRGPLGDDLEKLFDATVGNGIRMPIATKMLHKKRPRLIPILDALVVKHYWKKEYRGFYPVTHRRKRANATLGLLDLIQADLRGHGDMLCAGASRFVRTSNCGAAVARALTPARVLDIMVWAGQANPRLFLAGV